MVRAPCFLCQGQVQSLAPQVVWRGQQANKNQNNSWTLSLSIMTRTTGQKISKEVECEQYYEPTRSNNLKEASTQQQQNTHFLKCTWNILQDRPKARP